MKNGIAAGGAVLLAFLAGACASVDPRPDYDRAAGLIAESTGVSEVYCPEEEERARARVAALLSDGLTLIEAVEVALLNNPELQRAFLRIGLSNADLVQAGLLPNPILGFSLRFPNGSGATEIEGEFVQELTSLWLRGPRRQAALELRDQTILEVARQATELAASTRRTYFEALAARERRTIAAESTTVARGLLHVAEAREEAGAGTGLEVSVALSELGVGRIAERDAELALQAALLDLAGALGLLRPPRAEMLLSSLPEPLAWAADETLLVDLALQRRLDLQAAERVVGAMHQQLTVELRSRLPRLELGLSYEKGEEAGALGPAVGISVPLFDQNQAQIARARYLLASAEKARDALELAVTREVIGAWQRARVAWQTALLYRDELLPHDRLNMTLSREAYQEGKVSFLSALEAQHRFLAANREYIARRLQSALARPELEQALGVPLDALQIGRTNGTSGQRASD